eukprot:SAG11_NODE_35046_length_268_cov_1.816568_1_plen_47_part_01
MIIPVLPVSSLLQWARSAVAMGAAEICLTVTHEGGFALWPSNQTNYS